MLNLDEDLSAFYGLGRPVGAGRVLHTPTVFDAVVKTT
jgi:hypothetical protein